LTYPPQPPDPNRPQDTPRNFPTYTRPDQPQQPPPQQQPQPWQAPQQPPRQDSPYGRSETRYDGPQGPPPGAPQPPFVPPYQVPPQGAQYPGHPQYPQPQYGYGYPGDSQYKTNGLAIAALATGLGSILFAIAAPVAIGLGIAALVQIKRRREGGTAQAVVGLVAGSAVSVLWSILLVAVIATGVTDDDYGTTDTPISAPTFGTPTTYIDELVIGECYDESGGEDEVELVDCGSPHEAELFAMVILPPRTWPGEKEVRKESQAACDKAFLPYVGIAATSSVLDSVVWYPEEDAWSSGDREVFCTAYGADGDDLTGSVKGTKR